MTREKFSRTVLVLWLGIFILWGGAARYVVPGIIDDAYHGRSMSFLNGIISGQAEYPLRHYLERWNEHARSTTLQIMLFGSLLFLLTHQQFQRWVDSRSFDGTPMLLPGRRLAVVNTFVGFVLAASLWCIYRNEEYWPFSQYSMYAGLQEPRAEVFELRGIGSMGEFALSEEHIAPFDPGRLELAFIRLRTRPGGDALVSTALHDCLDRYERNRLARRHDGPPLFGLRAYDTLWALEPGRPAAGLSRSLRYEVRRDG